ncbi:hypothetical protein DOY81_007066, partial [Sarcophaga bullata]
MQNLDKNYRMHPTDEVTNSISLQPPMHKSRYLVTLTSPHRDKCPVTMTSTFRIVLIFVKYGSAIVLKIITDELQVLNSL